MESTAAPLTSSLSWDAYEHSKALKTQESAVQERLDNGLMARGPVLKRYTEYLTERLTWPDYEHPERYSNLKINYAQLCDPDSKIFSKARFTSAIAQKYQQDSITADSHQAEQALFDLFVWHAAFPFPSKGLDTIDEEAFMRGIALLTLEPNPNLHCELDSYDASPSLQNLHGDTWGPHEGDIIEKRRKGPHDYRRRLFRGLAIPIPADARLDASQTGSVTTIPVMCFYYHDEAGREVVVSKDEDERRIDVQDVLTEVPADWTPGVLHPSRVVYEKAASLLPGYGHYLNELCIPTDKLVALLDFLDARGLLTNGKLEDGVSTDGETKEASRSELGRVSAGLASGDAPAYIGWKQFNELLSDETTAHIAECLSAIFMTFKSTST